MKFKYAKLIDIVKEKCDKKISVNCIKVEETINFQDDNYSAIEVIVFYTSGAHEKTNFSLNYYQFDSKANKILKDVILAKLRTILKGIKKSN